MSQRVILPNKYEGEAIGLVFDFTSSLVMGGQLIDPASVFIIPYLGADSNAASMVAGTAVRVGNVVRQQIVNGVPGVTYTVTCSCGTSLGNFIRVQGFLTVLPSQP